MCGMNNDKLKLLITNIINEVIDALPSYAKNTLMENYGHSHKEYRMYEGHQHITAAFNDNSRLTFEVHFRNNHGEDRDKWRRKAFTKWKSLANEIYRDAPLNEVGNPMQKSWKQSFEEALEHPELQEFIRKNNHQRVFDPVNFTQTG